MNAKRNIGKNVIMTNHMFASFYTIISLFARNVDTCPGNYVGQIFFSFQSFDYIKFLCKFDVEINSE